MVNWPKRTPCLRSAPRASWSSSFTSVATASRGRTPIASEQAEGKAARKAGEGLIARHGKKRLELCGDLAVDEMLQATADLFDHLRACFFVHKGLDRRFRSLGTLHQLADRVGAPHQAALFGEIKLGIRRVVEAVSPR